MGIGGRDELIKKHTEIKAVIKTFDSIRNMLIHENVGHHVYSEYNTGKVQTCYVLTLSPTTNLRLFQIETNCRGLL